MEKKNRLHWGYLTAIVIGTLVFREAFTLNVAIGVALILFAILFMILMEKKA